MIIFTISLIILSGCAAQPDYSGELKNGLPHGTGILAYSSGVSFEGEFVEGKLTGFGFWRHPNGSRYEGEWQNNCYHGHGTLTIPGHYTYAGSWNKGIKEGFGIQTWTNGRRYEGQWAEGRRHGTGTLYYPDGSRYEGQWAEGRYHGSGTIYHADGEVLSGTWDKDTFIYIPIETIALTTPEVTLTSEDEPYQLLAATIPVDATKPLIAWVSESPDIALVEAGLITPLSPGEAKIIATTADGPAAECLVTVIPPPVPVAGMRLNLAWLNMYSNSDPIHLYTIIEPANADNKAVLWSSSNPDIVSVNPTGLVTPLQIGQAEITARTVDGGFTDSCIVTIRQPISINGIAD